MQHTGFIDGFIAKAPRIADPGLVHCIILPWFETIHLATMVMDIDVAPTRTPRTDGFRLLEETDPDLEAKILAGQGPNGTDIHRVSSIGIIESFPRKGGNLCRIAALEDAQFISLANLFAETHTARAQNATF